MNILKIIILFFSCATFAQLRYKNQDYLIYHQKINKAEKFFFIEKNVDSCLYYYDKVKEEFDFIFLKDLVNAAQIALFSKRSYKQYIEKGFEYGLKLEHLKKIKCFKPVIKELLNDSSLKKKYLINRKKYLEYINHDYLDITYDMGIKDQIDKQNTNYDNKKSIEKIKQFLIEKGFPGDRQIGVPDSLIFKELKSGKKDFYERLKKFGNRLDYFGLDINILSPKMLMLVMIHNFCSYEEMKSLWMKQIQKGNIHPRDVALLYDNTYRGGGQCFDEILGFYKINMFVDYRNLKFNKRLINEKRKNIFMTSIEVDEQKMMFEKEHGFKLFWGFWNCR